jgi:hypothetical protein
VLLSLNEKAEFINRDNSTLVDVEMAEHHSKVLFPQTLQHDIFREEILKLMQLDDAIQISIHLAEQELS